MGERLQVAVALVCLAAGCGRSELDDLGSGPHDAGSSFSDVSGLDGAGGGSDGNGVDGSPVDAGHSTDASNDGPAMDAISADAPAMTGDGGAPSCNPTTCPTSCCLPDGTCAPVENNQACGSGGRACVACGPGEFCKGDCAYYVDNCGASNCPGCCEQSNICAAGDSNYSCGHAGEECQRCIPSEGTGSCTPLGDAGGTCEALTTCGPANCSGCCSGNVCLLGDQDQACGGDGVACVVCKSGDSCIYDQTGGSPPTSYACTPTPCGPSTCTGCCDGLVCAEGTQDIACGTGGAACANCQSAGRSCTEGVCR